MSASQVLTTVRAALQDEAAGLAAKVAELKAADVALNRVRTDYQWVPVTGASRLQTTTAPNITIEPLGVQTEQKLSTYPTRDSFVRLRITAETFDGDAELTKEWALTTSTALLWVLDGIREYSEANAGTVIEIQAEPNQPSINMQFGNIQNDGALSYGFQCDFTIAERSEV